MKPFFTIVYIRIISLRWKFDDHPLVEYPLCYIIKFILNSKKNQITQYSLKGKSKEIFASCIR